MSRGSLRNPGHLHVQAVDRAICATGMLDDFARRARETVKRETAKAEA